MARNIGTDAEINRIRLKEQTSTPSPSSGYGYLYAKPAGLYFKGDNGVEVGPLSGTSILNLEKDLSAGSYNQARTEYQVVNAGATHTLLNYTGGQPGLISKIHVFVGVSGGASSLRDSRLKIYYDGNVSADIDVPLSLFFGAEYMGASSFSAFASEYIGASSDYGNQGGYYSHIPIPFSTGIKVEFTNGNGSTACTIWTEIVYYTGISNSWADGTRLKAVTQVLTNQTVDTVVTLADVSLINPGRLVGVYTMIDSAPNSASPAASPMEGNFKIFKDGGGSPIYESSGFEEMFAGGFYFVAKAISGNDYTASTSKYHGITYRSTVTWGGYRFFTPDPIYFSNAIKVTWNCGNSSQANFSGGVRVASCVWYYTS